MSKIPNANVMTTPIFRLLGFNIFPALALGRHSYLLFYIGK